MSNDNTPSKQGGDWNIWNLDAHQWVYQKGFETETEAHIWLNGYRNRGATGRYEVRRMGPLRGDPQ